jgi:hypothetical protein
VTVWDAIARLEIAFPHALSVGARDVEGPSGDRMSVVAYFWCDDYVNKFMVAFPLPSNHEDTVDDCWLQTVIADWRSRFLMPEKMARK